MKRQLIKLNAVTFTEPNLPVLDITDEEIEVVSMPGLVSWLDVQSKYLKSTGDIGMYDRVNGYVLKEFQQQLPVIGNYINGNPAINMNDGNVGLTIEGLSLHPPGSYTKIIVIQPETIVNAEFLGAVGSECRLKLNNAGRVEIVHDSTVSQTADSLSLSTPYFIMACYDAEANYARVFINGTESLLNIPNIPQQTVGADLSFGFSKTIGQFFDGFMGDALVFNADYSKPEYSEYLSRLKSIMAVKYSLAIV